MDAELDESRPLEGDEMILDILLSIVITFGASGLTGNFNECPAASEPETVQQA